MASVSAYTAAEDSSLLRNALKGYSGKMCLEMGTGNGGTLVELKKRFEIAVGTDLVRPEMGDWAEEGANVVLADAAACLKSSTFDLVAFNPPYLRGDPVDRAVDGGKELEVPRRFLEEALRVVREDGSIVMLLNDDADVRTLGEVCEKSGFKLDKVESERLFFEELSVYMARKAGD